MNLVNLPWDEIKKLVKEGKYKGKFDKIPKTTFAFVAKEENKEAVREAAIKSLRMTDPATAYAQAIPLADTMQAFAKRMLKR